MLYVLGDSYTYGDNFRIEQERIESVWPTHLANLLSIPHQNISLPGSSNWRMARLAMTLPITKDDIVIIALAPYLRFEFGVNNKHTFSPPTLPGDINQVEGDLITKRFFPSLTHRTSDIDTRTFNTLAFGPFSNNIWFRQMHNVMCNSIAHRLHIIGCKSIMFDAWYPNPAVDIPDFLLPGSTINQLVDDVCIVGNRQSSILANLEQGKVGRVEIPYWSAQQHKQIANILYRYIQGEQIESLSTNNKLTDPLDRFY